MLWFQKTMSRGKNTLDAVKFELLNYQLPTIARVRVQGFVYVHGTLRQGHTNRGQLLGASPGVFAAAASLIEWSRYSNTGRTSCFLRRIVRAEAGNFFVTGVVDRHAYDVIVAGVFQRTRV